ncbi:MAG: Acyltransferase [Frankiales bacterium]|jgi:1-acyl-sn-glycerol-3-phosphate acyltransferase|nr:Acyltransferase [Frankiales bacterium]
MSLLVVVGLGFAVTLLPLLVLVAVALSAVLPGRWRALRLLAFAFVYLAVECAALAVAFVLWLVSGCGWKLSSPAFQRAHYAVIHLVLAVVLGSATLLFHLRVVDDEVSWSPLDDGVPGSTNAMLVLSRHAGPGDSLLMVRTLMRRDHDRRPRIVLKDLLQLDPLIDVYLNRLPNAFLTPGRGDLAAQVGRLAEGMGEEDALLIFPEGGNFSEGRRLRAIDRLRGKGLHERAAQAASLRHVLPPKHAGVAAALAAAPEADVVLVAHTGLEHLSSPADLWDGLPMDSVVRMRWWFVPAAEVPREPEAQAAWLFDRWAEIDAWVASYVEA